MTPEFREQLMASLDEAAAFAGAKDYEEAVANISKTLERFQFYLNEARTKADLIRLVDKLGELPPPDQMYAIALLQNMPGIVRLVFTQHLPKLTESLPPLPPGRKQALSVEQRLQICDCISRLHRDGYSLQQSKEWVVERYGFKLRSVERAWSRRSETNLQRPKIAIEELLGWISRP